MTPAVSCEIEFRVPYADVDQMGCVHHRNYLKYFEQGRTELLRETGWAYRELEESGTFFVVTNAQCSYHSPARYDELLSLTSTVKRVTLARIDHCYELRRKADGQLIIMGKRMVDSQVFSTNMAVAMAWTGLVILFGANVFLLVKVLKR